MVTRREIHTCIYPITHVVRFIPCTANTTEDVRDWVSPYADPRTVPHLIVQKDSSTEFAFYRGTRTYLDRWQAEPQPVVRDALAFYMLDQGLTRCYAYRRISRGNLGQYRAFNQSLQRQLLFVLNFLSEDAGQLELNCVVHRPGCVCGGTRPDRHQQDGSTGPPLGITRTD